ncbi:MAG: hypothetical protein WAR22_00105 [Desulfomonilia bacterium]|jgi:hypothetical protein
MSSISAAEPLNRAVRKLLAGPGKRYLGQGLRGFAVPVALFILEDISRPDGVILPFCRWVINKTARVRVVDICGPGSGSPLERASKAVRTGQG